jgi:hypothetical protein
MAKKKSRKKTSQKAHPWRLCPAGQYYRSASVVHSYTRSDGTHVNGHTRSETCAFNPSGKDQLYPDEINELAKRHFTNKLEMPCQNGNKKFDLNIAGWTKYWNDIFKESPRLDPNLVKALIESESTFREEVTNKDKRGRPVAWGLLQLRNLTRRILGDERGELKDHYLTLTKEDLLDGNANICAGVRWLFHKRTLASSKLKRPASWMEAIIEYKGLDLRKKRDQELLKRISSFYEKYSKCKK